MLGAFFLLRAETLNLRFKVSASLRSALNGCPPDIQRPVTRVRMEFVNLRFKVGPIKSLITR